MEKQRFNLTSREQAVMEMILEHPEGITSVEIYNASTDIFDNTTQVHRAINTLLERELIAECGCVRTTGKIYARKFAATVTKDEFMVGLMEENKIDFSKLTQMAASLVNAGKVKNSSDKESIISELQGIIDKLKGE